MMLVESIPKEPLCFQLIRFDNQKISYTIQVSKAFNDVEYWTVVKGYQCVERTCVFERHGFCAFLNSGNGADCVLQP